MWTIIKTFSQNNSGEVFRKMLLKMAKIINFCLMLVLKYKKMRV